MVKELQLGFQQMLVEAASTTSIPGFSCVILEEHPFQLPFQESLHYVDGPTDASVRGFIRLTGWAMTNDCLGVYIPVTFLRTVYAETETRGEHRIYYEAGIGKSDHYMAGECTDCSGTGAGGKRRLDSYFEFLSAISGVEIEQVNIEFPRSERVYRQVLPGTIHEAKKENKKYRKGWESELRRKPNFRAGYFVWLTGEGLSVRNIENKAYKVMRVENTPNYCSCGLGDDLGTMISVHPERKCNLRRRFEAMHHQLVTLDLGSGNSHVFSGHYLVPDSVAVR